jgi:hypothetical protein
LELKIKSKYLALKEVWLKVKLENKILKYYKEFNNSMHILLF